MAAPGSLIRRRRAPSALAVLMTALVAAACTSAQRPELVQPTQDPSSTPVETTIPLPDRADCPTLNGAGPAVLAVGGESVPCVVVAAHHRVELRNQGATVFDVTAGSTSLALGAGSSLLTEPAGTIFAVGANRLAAGTDTLAAVWLIAPSEDPLAGSEIDLTSIGDVELGLQPAGVTAAAGGPAVPAQGSACYVTGLDGDPYSPLFTFRDDQLVVVQVFTPGIATLSGIGVGSTSADITAAYGDRVQPRAAPDGDPARQLFVFEPSDEEDLIYRLVFDLRDDRVTSLRFGAAEIVADRPGCG